MEEFIEKWKNNKKFQTKLKLGLSTIFVVIVSIYAISYSQSAPNYSTNTIIQDNKDNINNNSNNEDNSKDIIKIKDQYEYETKILINDKEYIYRGNKTLSKETIEKVEDNKITNYIYQDNKYYINNNGIYIVTTKDVIYDVVNYNYINLEIINKYISSSTKENNQYLVYLKDIILGNTSEDYFVIRNIDNKITIDYTPLMREFDKNIEKYTVIIKIM